MEPPVPDEGPVTRPRLVLTAPAMNELLQRAGSDYRCADGLAEPGLVALLSALIRRIDQLERTVTAWDADAPPVVTTFRVLNEPPPR
jgi:hypothetical protein